MVKAVIVAGGAHASTDRDVLIGADVVMAADGGANWLASLGQSPDGVIGDFDSIDPDLLEKLIRTGVPHERHPVEKDASDLELSMAAAMAIGADELVILGALGGEVDHFAANLLLLGSDLAAGRPVSLVHDRTTVRHLTGPSHIELAGGVGTRVSLLPVGGPAVGVTTRGLQWPLDDDRLEAGSSRGLANIVTGRPASVSVRTGQLLIIETEPREQAVLP